MKADFGQTAPTVYELVADLRKSASESLIDKDFPHIAEKIKYLWGTIELLEQLEPMLQWHPTEERPNRAGFPMEVVTEITVILNYHYKKFPFIRTERYNTLNDVWGGAPDKGDAKTHSKTDL